jgi:predicted nucleotide-binding protein (sugar kinase/HSP70/actin superfamily)
LDQEIKCDYSAYVEHEVPKPLFTLEMKKDYTILAPQMLPVHFELFQKIFEQYGYRMEILTNTDKEVVDEGLRNVHNDTCYPALLVIGQMINALKSGKYDLHKVALLLTQTGGGCRASNYVHLLRKALEKLGWGFIPVISFNINSMESHPGFKMNLGMLYKMLYACLYGDMIMWLKNQCLPYEKTPGQTEQVTEKLIAELAEGFKSRRFARLKKNYRQIVAAYNSVERELSDKVKVGIVGEIYVKYAPLGNNDLEKYLLSEGAEPVIAGLMDFMLYGFNNNFVDARIYKNPGKWLWAIRLAFKYAIHMQKVMADIVAKESDFRPPAPFDKLMKAAEGYISDGVKMGEGWLLTGEMVEYIENGVNNIITCQPFGCLPNHIVAKGMIRAIKNRHPEANIVAIDYDPGATRTNQENRIRLMLANAREYQRRTAEPIVPVEIREKSAEESA